VGEEEVLCGQPNNDGLDRVGGSIGDLKDVVGAFGVPRLKVGPRLHVDRRGVEAAVARWHIDPGKPRACLRR